MKSVIKYLEFSPLISLRQILGICFSLWARVACFESLTALGSCLYKDDYLR